MSTIITQPPQSAVHHPDDDGNPCAERLAAKLRELGIEPD
jgi:hypothetical protein